MLASRDSSWCESDVQHEERIQYLIGIIARVATEAVRAVARAQVAIADAAPAPSGEEW